MGGVRGRCGDPDIQPHFLRLLVNEVDVRSVCGPRPFTFQRAVLFNHYGDSSSSSILHQMVSHFLVAVLARPGLSFGACWPSVCCRPLSGMVVAGSVGRALSHAPWPEKPSGLSGSSWVRLRSHAYRRPAGKAPRLCNALPILLWWVWCINLRVNCLVFFPAGV